MDKDGNGMIGYGEFLEMVLRQVRYFIFYSTAIIICRHMFIFPGRREGDIKKTVPWWLANLFRWQVAIFGCSKVKIVLCTNPRTETIFGANVAQNMVHLIEELFSLTSHIYPEIYKKTCIVNKPNFKPNIEYVDSSRKIFRHYQVLVCLYIRFLIFKKENAHFHQLWHLNV